MKRRYLASVLSLILILILILMLLSACAAADNGGANEESPFLIRTETKPDSDAYRSIYRQVVADSDESTVFSLIYLNDDDIPELAAGDRGNDSYSIYTVKDGAIFYMVDSLTTVELTYFERSSIVATFARWNGGGDEGGYGQDYYQISANGTIGDEVTGVLPVLSYSYNAVYDEKGVYTGEGVTSYSYMGQETDEAVYMEMAATMGITADGGRLCLENAVSREGMLDLLK